MKLRPRRVCAVLALVFVAEIVGASWGILLGLNPYVTALAWGGVVVLYATWLEARR